MLSPSEAEILLQHFTTLPNMQIGTRNVAFLECDRIVFHTHGTSTQPHAPHSPIVDLIQGIYEADPLQARRIVRNRIYSTTAPTEMCRGMVKLAARRLTAPLSPSSPLDSHGQNNSSPLPELKLVSRAAYSSPSSKPDPHSLWTGKTPPNRDEDFMQLARQLAATVSREGPQYECDRPIAALLVSADGIILSWGLNTTIRNKTLHAEVNMLQSFHQRTGQPIPDGAKIYTTLKPCRMCAGMIWHCAQDITSIKVYYDQFDPGPNARETVLNPRSQERRRVNNPALLDLQVETKLSPE